MIIFEAAATFRPGGGVERCRSDSAHCPFSVLQDVLLISISFCFPSESALSSLTPVSIHVGKKLYGNQKKYDCVPKDVGTSFRICCTHGCFSPQDLGLLDDCYNLQHALAVVTVL